MPEVQNEKNNKLFKYQIFEHVRVHRSQIKFAEYNPRFIEPENKKKLKRAIKNGLVGGICWNVRTGNIVGGHQRVMVMDELDKSMDYYLDVDKIDVDEVKEKELNVILNNPNLQGQYDNEMLADLLIGDNIAISDVGFTQADAEVMFSETQLSLLNGYEQPEEVKNDIETIKKMKEMRKTAMKRYKQLESTEYYKIIVFDSTENLQKFIEHFGLNAKEKYIGGEELAAKLGLDLPMRMKDEWGRDMGQIPQNKGICPADPVTEDSE